VTVLLTYYLDTVSVGDCSQRLLPAVFMAHVDVFYAVFNTSANEVMFQAVCVCLSICLSVTQLHVKTADWIFMKFYYRCTCSQGKSD